MTAFSAPRNVLEDGVSPPDPVAASSTQFTFILNLCRHPDGLHSVSPGRSRRPKEPRLRSPPRPFPHETTAAQSRLGAPRRAPRVCGHLLHRRLGPSQSPARAGISFFQTPANGDVPTSSRESRVFFTALDGDRFPEGPRCTSPGAIRGVAARGSYRLKHAFLITTE